MICPKCKNEIPTGSNICPSCGVDLTKMRMSSEGGASETRRGASTRARQTRSGAYRRSGAQPNPQALAVAGGLVVVFLVLLVLLFRAIFGGGDSGTPGTGVPVETPAPSPTFKIFGVDTNTPTPAPTEDPLANIQLQMTPEPTTTPEPVYQTLKKGSKGDDVKRLQEALIALGYLEDGGADGDYGNATVAAVKEFQKDNGLGTDGQAGQQTLTTLYRKYGGDIDTTGTSSAGTSGNSGTGTTDTSSLILDQPG